jgi:AraC-like DNA-binding protein
MAWIESPMITAAAASVDPSWAGGVSFRHTPKARDHLLSLLAFELCDAIDQGAAPGRLYIEALAAAFLIRIVKRHGLRRTEMRHWGISTDDARIARTIAYLDRHLAGNVRLSATARAVGLSPPHLSDIFKTATGETIGSLSPAPEDGARPETAGGKRAERRRCRDPGRLRERAPFCRDLQENMGRHPHGVS